MSTQKVRVGFIGLGIMGGPMAGHILGAGYPLSVYNRTASRVEERASRGARVRASPVEVAAEAEVVITMVSDSPDVEEVIAGSDGVVKAIRPDSVVVDMSTISPEVERVLSKLLQTKHCHLVDAPVSGGDVGARNASLAIMAGGEREIFERVRPLLEVMGQPNYCGSVGCGQLTKLCNQILVGMTLLGVSEALAYAQKNNLDPRVMVKATQGGAAGSWQLSHLASKIIDRDFAPGFMVDLMDKDLRLVLESAETTGVPLPGTSLVARLFKKVQEEGRGREGIQALAKVLEAMAGLTPDPLTFVAPLERCRTGECRGALSAPTARSLYRPLCERPSGNVGGASVRRFRPNARQHDCTKGGYAPSTSARTSAPDEPGPPPVKTPGSPLG